MMRSTNYLLAIVTLSSLLASRTVEAQNSGLLLGINVSTPDSGSSYRTYWIAPERGSVRLVASGPDLLVPRRSGFWRLCLVDRQEVSEGENSEFDSLVAGPATPDRGQCAIRDVPATDEQLEAARCYRTVRQRLMFVGSDAVSLELNEETDCGAHYSGGTHATLASLDDAKPVEYSKFLEPARRRALMRAGIKAAREAFADFGTVDTTETESDAATEGARLRVLNEWGVERGAGRWQTVGQVSCWPYVACGNGQHRFSLAEFAPPRALVGHDALSPSLASIRRRFPAVTDAVSSPRGDLLVALTTDSLLVFKVRNGDIGMPVLRIPESGQIVMAQWATGRFVGVWSAEIARLTKGEPR